jgi:hypothetical protein
VGASIGLFVLLMRGNLSFGVLVLIMIRLSTRLRIAV